MVEWWVGGWVSALPDLVFAGDEGAELEVGGGVGGRSNEDGVVEFAEEGAMGGWVGGWVGGRGGAGGWNEVLGDGSGWVGGEIEQEEGWVGGWMGLPFHLVHFIEGNGGFSLLCSSHSGPNLWEILSRWVGGWVGKLIRGERGGPNALLYAMGGWVGGWVSGVSYLVSQCSIVPGFLGDH